eukprot:TRINITY_DN7509_c0_g6_i1.p1 TRINITY_DN7509_c0_g6~~TRINITY_DN7509_c0_g6_i1.p1  ORF type:complete len:317 (+),score=88.51 TRINITY_DN7509_c0_g6_i1:59-1009(+)
MSGVRHILKISDLTRDEVLAILDEADHLKKHPKVFAGALQQQTLLMLFEKPSLRTRVSFEVGMTQMGGHAIFYSTADSPLGKKETVADTAKVVSRYCEFVMARLNKRETLRELAANATVPVINALDDFAHPCQILADLQTIREKLGKESLATLKMAYFGDCYNNVTYDLMRAAALLGYEIRVCGPAGEGYAPEPEVVEECNALNAKSGGKLVVTNDPTEAATGVHVIYTDSWMSYHIDKAQMEERIKTFGPYQVTTELLALADPKAIFMNCLPAARGMEQTAEVVDGPQSVVFDEAENRLHAQKALLLFLSKSKQQ